MTDKEILQSARALIADKGWCQKSYALDAKGNSIDLDGEPELLSDCRAFCSAGAILASLIQADRNDAYTFGAVINCFNNANDINSVLDFNDTPGRTRDEVIAAFDRAIATA